MDSGKIPFIEIYQGVGIHDCQPTARIETVVKPEIDAVMQMTDIGALVEHAADQIHAPESRLLAAAMVQAIFTIAVEQRRERPDVDIDLVKASAAGLDSRQWRDCSHYCSLFDVHPPGPRRAMQRETPIGRN